MKKRAAAFVGWGVKGEGTSVRRGIRFALASLYPSEEWSSPYEQLPANQPVLSPPLALRKRS